MTSLNKCCEWPTVVIPAEKGTLMSANEFVDFYELLQLSSNADTETIERIFRHLAKKLHPDQSDLANNDQFIKIVEAYEVLSDPETRAGYDARYQDYWNRKWKLKYQWLSTCLK
jgi:curved DNA-binding protein